MSAECKLGKKEGKEWRVDTQETVLYQMSRRKPTFLALGNHGEKGQGTCELDSENPQACSTGGQQESKGHGQTQGLLRSTQE
ncbi:hypothetical protein P7K49_032587 [Saguinus oedipus]|uniref:Uncharacterized protein n=1 Tax=Saguinus oedipus TaxID=9490 RepID=A0ABQ9TYQ1_SAGOE|nr:hypothetical protein P7K49_032587 [Saguinus oedipus]